MIVLHAPRGQGPARAAMMKPSPAAGMTRKSVRAGLRAVPMKSAPRAADQPAMPAAVLKAHVARPRATAETIGPRVVDSPAARRPHGLGHRAEVMKAQEIEYAAPSGRMTATGRRVRPTAVIGAPTTVLVSPGNALMTAAATVIAHRAHRTAVPIGVPTGPSPANRARTSAGTMTVVGATEATGFIVVDRNATSLPTALDKAAAVHPNASRKPGPTMCA